MTPTTSNHGTEETAAPPAHAEPNHVVDTSGRPQGSHGVDDDGGGSGGGAAIPNHGGSNQEINPDRFASPSEFYGPAPSEASGSGGRGGGGEIPVPSTAARGQWWESLLRVPALLVVWAADYVASLVESPTASSMVRDLCAQVSFAVLAAALHGLHCLGAIDDGTCAGIAHSMPTWDAAWAVFSPPGGGRAEPGGGDSGGGDPETPNGDGQEAAGAATATATATATAGRELCWRLLFWWLARLCVSAVDCFLERCFVDYPSASSMVRDCCKQAASSLLSALLRDLYLWGAMDGATREDIAARMQVPGWWYDSST